MPNIARPTPNGVAERIAGARVSCAYRRGPRPPVLLIHGNSSCSAVFERQIDWLASAGHTVVAPDLPGHGRSEDAKRPRSTYSFPGYADVLSELMRRLGIPNFHVVGWSLGGHIGLEMWSRMSSVLSLTITGTPPVELSSAGVAAGFKGMSALSLAGKSRFSPRDARAYADAMLGERVDGRSMVFKTISRTDGRARRWMVRNGLCGIGVDQAEAVRRCDRPLAIIQGVHDPFLNVDYLKKLKYRNLWLNSPVLMEAGHAPHWSHPASFNRHYSDFLSGID